MTVSIFARFFKSTLLKNTVALFFLQLVNYITPLAILPILGRNLSVSEFGLVSITISIIQLSNIVTDYGFTYYATCEISTHRQNKNYIQELISTIFTSKLILLLMVIISLLAIATLTNLKPYEGYFFAATIAIVAQTFQPIWFFQGVEKMKNITLYTVISKILYVIFVYVLINNHGDGVKAIISFGVAQLVGMIISLYELRKEGFYCNFAPFSKGVKMLKSTQGFFWARLSAAAYSSANSIFIGALYGPVNSAYYAAAEQIYKVCIFAPVPVNQSLYPYMVRERNWKIFIGILLAMSALMVAGSAFVFIFSDEILEGIFGHNYIVSVSLVKVLMVAVVLNYISSNLGYPLFGALGKANIANIPIVLCAFFYGVFIAVLYILKIGDVIWVAWGVVVTEIIMIMLNMFFALKLVKGELCKN